jgi:site-specific DNA-cytosine methylase
VKMLDLFCGPGGAAMGYHRAGWQVLGVDNEPQPDYPFGFVLGDAMEYLEEHWMEFDAVHASPPCLFSSALNKGTNDGGKGHVDLVPTVRRRLAQLPLPTIVENVKGASLRPDLTLCGLMFGLRTYRHRYFEVSFPVPRPGHPEHLGRVNGYRHGRWIKGSMLGVWGHTGGGKGSLADWQEALDAPWITSKKSLANAIPPAYTEHIGGAIP